MEWPRDNSLEWWMPVFGFEYRYWASNIGRVWGPRGLLRPAIEIRMQPARVNPDVRRFVRLYHNGARVHWQVARAVLTAFTGLPPEDKPFACHRDGDSLNNTIQNLYWSTGKQNQVDRYNHAREHKHG